MKTKNWLKLTIIAFSFVVLIIGAFYLQWIPKANLSQLTGTQKNEIFGWKYPVANFPSTGLTDDSLAYSDIRDPGGIPQGLPVRLKIPTIGVDSAIEDAYISNDGRMDVPVGSVNVAWFSLGPYPGRVGSAVIGGHFGITNGVPFVFYNLDKLKAGDKVYIVDDKNDTLAFQVKSVKSFDRNADATSVFTSQDGKAHLNLITCEGLWNQINDTYPDRLVVFTDAIPSEGAVEVNKEPQKVAKLPATAITPEPFRESQVIAQPAINLYEVKALYAVKSLYKTPTDGLVTFFLLISIVFVALKIFEIQFHHKKK